VKEYGRVRQATGGNIMLHRKDAFFMQDNYGKNTDADP
jgi:hypothetical protein